MRRLAVTNALERAVALLEAGRVLSIQHYRQGHPEPVEGCPVCFNCQVTDIRLADGEDISQEAR